MLYEYNLEGLIFLKFGMHYPLGLCHLPVLDYLALMIYSGVCCGVSWKFCQVSQGTRVEYTVLSKAILSMSGSGCLCQFVWSLLGLLSSFIISLSVQRKQ